MSGAAGHISHIHECWDLSFSDLEDFIEYVSFGNLEAFEKFDGVNIVFSLKEDGQLVFARGSNDIKSGGLSLQDLKQKFADRPKILDAFVSAYQVLDLALGSLFPAQKHDFFYAVGQTWYSAEIIYSQLANVITYSSNCLVLHESPVFRVGFDGVLRSCTVIESRNFHKSIDQLNSAVATTGWSIIGPHKVKIQKFDSDRFSAALDSIRDIKGLNYDSTLREYVYVSLQKNLHNLLPELSNEIRLEVAKRICKYENYKSLTDIKKMIRSKATIEKIRDLVGKETELINAAIQPIEEIFYEFSIAALAGLSSSILKDSFVTSIRISERVRDAMISQANNSSASRHIQKLKLTDAIDIRLEGVVFVWKQRLIKLTGQFAPANALLGVEKYGR